MSEEQALELEALESLFPVELAKVSPTEFSLCLVPFSDNSQTNFVSVDLHFVYPKEYPERVPVKVSVAKTTGSIETDTRLLADLRTLIANVCEENTGNCCVYQIAESVQEWLRANNEEEKSLHDWMLEGRKKKALDSDYDDEDDSDWNSDDEEDDEDDDDDEEEEEDESFVGLQTKDLCPESERVTASQFAAWKITNDAMLMNQGLIKRISEFDVRQTGKQQFLQTLKGRTNVGVATAEELFGDDIELDDDEE